MDLSAIIVILVLTALSIGAIVWMEVYSRGTERKEASALKASEGRKGSRPDRSISKNHSGDA